MALAMILLWTSPMPIGLTPEHLFRGISLHATKGAKMVWVDVGCAKSPSDTGKGRAEVFGVVE